MLILLFVIFQFEGLYYCPPPIGWGFRSPACSPPPQTHTGHPCIRFSSLVVPAYLYQFLVKWAFSVCTIITLTVIYTWTVNNAFIHLLFLTYSSLNSLTTLKISEYIEKMSDILLMSLFSSWHPSSAPMFWLLSRPAAQRSSLHFPSRSLWASRSSVSWAGFPISWIFFHGLHSRLPRASTPEPSQEMMHRVDNFYILNVWKYPYSIPTLD